MKSQIKLVVIGIIVGALIGLFSMSYFSETSRRCRSLEKQNKVLRLMAEQRELQFKILQIEARIKPKEKKANVEPAD